MARGASYEHMALLQQGVDVHFAGEPMPGHEVFEKAKQYLRDRN